jgi:putative FmdB family regulatory protein
MPIYEFLCKKCSKEFSELTNFDETNKYPDVVCPHCSSKKKEKIMSIAGFNFSNPVGTDKFNNSHDYRHGWNLNKPGGALETRRNAEKKSHMGQTNEIYRPIDDLNKDKSWGKVK